MGAFCQKSKTKNDIRDLWSTMDIFIHFHQLGQTPERCSAIEHRSAVRTKTEYINTIRPQVLDFYNRLSRALGDTLANADDMKAGGIQLQKVPISSPLSSSFLSSSSIITENLPKKQIDIFLQGSFFL